MNPSEHDSRPGIGFFRIGIFVLVVGGAVAIYNREILERFGVRRDSIAASQSPVVEPSAFDATDSIEIPPPAVSVSDFESPPPYDPFGPEFDLTKGKGHVCPVHKVRMPAKVVQICSTFEKRWFSEFEKSKSDEFPFAYTFVRGGYVSPIAPPSSGIWFFCGTGLPPPTSAKMFVCPQCLAAYGNAVRAFNPKAEAIRRAEEAEAVRRAQPSRRNSK